VRLDYRPLPNPSPEVRGAKRPVERPFACAGLPMTVLEILREVSSFVIFYVDKYFYNQFVVFKLPGKILSNIHILKIPYAKT
jgi:hypothetical protein